MPTIPLDEFDSPPDIGDKVKVTGKVERIDEDTDEVYISYDKVEIVDEDKKKKKKRKYRRDDDVTEYVTVDEALARSFPPAQPMTSPTPAGPGAFQG